VTAVATEAAIAAAVTVAAIGKVLAAAAAEDVLAAAVVAADAADAVAADSARVAHATFLLPSTLRHKAANLAAAIVAETVAQTVVEIAAGVIRSAVVTIIAGLGVTSTIAVPMLRVRPHHPIPRKNPLYCLANRSRSIAGVRYLKRLQLLQLPSQNASNRGLNPMNRSRAFPVSRLRQTLRVVRVADCPVGFSPALLQRASKQWSRTSPSRKISPTKCAVQHPRKLTRTKKLR
jgi:hypothetical protein